MSLQPLFCLGWLKSANWIKVAAWQGAPRRADVSRIDADMGCEFQQFRFMREDEVEHGRQEGRVACRLADILRSEAALGKKAAETVRITGNEGEGLSGYCFSGIRSQTTVFSSF